MKDRILTGLLLAAVLLVYGQYFQRNELDAAAAEYQIALKIIPDSPDTLATFAALEYQRGNF
jgi:hypothetical protein